MISNSQRVVETALVGPIPTITQGKTLFVRITEVKKYILTFKKKLEMVIPSYSADPLDHE